MEPTRSTFDIKEMIQALDELNHLFEQEIDYLTSMKLTKVRNLNEKRDFLLGKLEGFKRQLHQQPQLIEQCDQADIDAFKEQSIRLEDNIVKESEALMIAKGGHQIMMHAITSSLNASEQSGAYDGQGTHVASAKAQHYLQPVNFSEES